MKENEFDTTQNAIDEVLLSFTTEDLDSYTPDTKRIVYTQEQKDVICAKALTLFKQDQVLPENNNVHKIPLDYLPRDKINEEHVTRVYGVNEIIILHITIKKKRKKMRGKKWLSRVNCIFY